MTSLSVIKNGWD